MRGLFRRGVAICTSPAVPAVTSSIFIYPAPDVYIVLRAVRLQNPSATFRDCSIRANPAVPASSVLYGQPVSFCELGAEVRPGDSSWPTLQSSLMPASGSFAPGASTPGLHRWRFPTLSTLPFIFKRNRAPVLRPRPASASQFGTITLAGSINNVELTATVEIEEWEPAAWQSRDLSLYP